jgi:hypothetical protein
MATSKVAVIAFSAQPSIFPPTISAEQNYRYPGISLLVHQVQAMQKGASSDLLPQSGTDPRQEETSRQPLTFVQAKPEQSQPVITSAPIRVHPSRQPKRVL